MKAIEHQAGPGEGSDQRPISADEPVDVGQLLEGLELRLTQALGLLPQSERIAATMAVDAVLEFVISVPGWELRGLGDPFWRLLTALEDLDFGRVGALLAPNPAVRNRKPDTGMRKIVKAHAVFYVVLCQSGWSVTDGCNVVAKSLQENGVPFGGRIDSPSWKSVKGWRDRSTKLAEDDQTRAMLEGLRPHLVSLSHLTREQALDFVKGQMREVLSKMGSGALE